MNLTEWMRVVLGIIFLVILVSLWKAHQNKEFQFNVFDMIMENGRVSRLAFVFMVSFAVSTWIIINQEMTKRLTEGMFGIWVAAWVSPIVVMMINKSINSATTTTTSSLSVETKEVIK